MTTYNLNSVTGSDPNTSLNALLAAVKPADALYVGSWAQALGFIPSLTNVLTAEVANVPSPPLYPLGGTGGELFLFTGSGTANVFDAQGGNILADPGNITYFGPTNPGATGGDTLLGGIGSTMLAVAGNNELVSMQGMATLIGGSGSDILFGGMSSTSTDSLYAGSGTETLVTFAGNNLLAGGSGTDYLGGGTGADTLIGGAGSDILYAGTGNNVLIGGSGANWLGGNFGAGAGYDFMYSTATSSSATNTIVGGTGGAVDGLYGASNVVIGSSSAWDYIFAGYGAANESDTIYGGHNTFVAEANASTAIQTETVVGGITQITFNNGQTLDSWNATIHFSDGKSLKT